LGIFILLASWDEIEILRDVEDQQQKIEADKEILMNQT